MNDDLAFHPDLSDDAPRSLVEPVLAEAEALHARVLAARREQCQSYYALAALLCEVVDSGAHRVLGYANAIDYAVATLSLERREARDLLRVGRRTRDLPAIRAAMSTGELDWTKGREILRVADAHNEAAWVDVAKRSTSRVLEKLIAKAAPGDTPDEAATREEIPRESRVRRVLELEATDDEIVSRGFAWIRALR